MKKFTFCSILFFSISLYSCDTNKTKIGNVENNMGEEEQRTPNTNYNDSDDTDTTINMNSGGGTGTGQYKADSLVNSNKDGGGVAQ